MALFYDWVNDAQDRCTACGRRGTWYWKGDHFIVDHAIWHGRGECRVEALTATEERALRKAKGRKKVY
jgi:hypothetical protein